MRQHLAAVRAAASIGGAEVKGDAVGSQALEFHPGIIQPGDYHFSVGTAGSATLVLQTILIPLLLAGRPSNVVLEGGTHNSASPPFDFLKSTFLPSLRKAGAEVQLTFHRYGFYPAGGGKFEAHIHPVTKLGRIEVMDRGEMLSSHARALVSHLSPNIARRELAVLRERTGWDKNCFRAEVVDNSPGPGNIVLVDLEFPSIREVIAGFGEKGVRAEEVGGKVAQEVERYLGANVPVGEHLADQLLIPMAVGLLV